MNIRMLIAAVPSHPVPPRTDRLIIRICLLCLYIRHIVRHGTHAHLHPRERGPEEARFSPARGLAGGVPRGSFRFGRSAP